MPDAGQLPWAVVKSAGSSLQRIVLPDLGAGEREALAVALELPGSLAVLDDGLARRFARLLGVRHTGTLGILLRAKERGLVSAIRLVLDDLAALRFRVDSVTRAAVLRLANEPKD